MPLFPLSDPFATFHLPVTDGHELYVAQYGTPVGTPVVSLHGGPGSGGKPKHAQLFDPATTHVIVFDQRGCGQSRWPNQNFLGRIHANTTAHLVADIEALRTHMGIQKWLVYGYSWGSTLGLAYTQAHPERVLGIITGGVLLGSESEKRWFTHPDGMARFHPQAYADIFNLLPPGTTPDTVDAAALEVITGGDAEVSARLVRAWSLFEMLASDTTVNMAEIEAALADTAWLLPHSLLEVHYLRHNWFVEEGQLLGGAARMKGFPTHIIQSELDMVCPPIAAHALHQALAAAGASSALEMIPLSGHASNPALEDARVTAIAAMLAKVTSPR